MVARCCCQATSRGEGPYGWLKPAVSQQYRRRGQLSVVWDGRRADLCR